MPAELTFTNLLDAPEKLAGVSVNATKVVEAEMPVRFDPSTDGSLPVPSSCTILFAPVPTSTFNVAEPEVAPPVKPVPAITAVISPAPVEAATNEEPFQLNTCPDDIPEVSTSESALILAAPIRASALALVKYKF